MENRRFNYFDVFVTIVSFGTLVLDIGTDLTVTVQFFVNGDPKWGSLMLVFIVVPLLVMNLFSIKWHSSDGSLTPSLILAHVCLLAPFHRYMHVLRLGYKSYLTGQPQVTERALREQNDASILRLLETFLEAAPQLVLQLYVMMLRPHHLDWVQGLSAGCSLLSLAWALTAYSDTLRLYYQSTYRRRFAALCLHCSWRLFMVSARVAALVLFASVFHAWLFLFAGVHWLVMTLGIWQQGTDFGRSRAERVLFRVVSGFIYIFVFLNVHDGRTRLRMTLYYCIAMMENVVLFAVWCGSSNPASGLVTVTAVVIFLGFFLGSVCMLAYYRWFHPSGPNYLSSFTPTIPTLHSTPKSTQVPERQDANFSVYSPTIPDQSPELNLALRTPVKDADNGGNLTLSYLLDSATKGEVGWCNGMNDSLADDDDDSLISFTGKAKSQYSATLNQSRLSRLHAPSVQCCPDCVSPSSAYSVCQQRRQCACVPCHIHHRCQNKCHVCGQRNHPGRQDNDDTLEDEVKMMKTGSCDELYLSPLSLSSSCKHQSSAWSSASHCHQHSMSSSCSGLDNSSHGRSGMTCSSQDSALSPLNINTLWRESLRRIISSTVMDMLPGLNRSGRIDESATGHDEGCGGTNPSPVRQSSNSLNHSKHQHSTSSVSVNSGHSICERNQSRTSTTSVGSLHDRNESCMSDKSITSFQSVLSQSKLPALNESDHTDDMNKERGALHSSSGKDMSLKLVPEAAWHGEVTAPLAEAESSDISGPVSPCISDSGTALSFPIQSSMVTQSLSPSFSSNTLPPCDTPWRLGDLRLNPAPPVEEMDLRSRDSVHSQSLSAHLSPLRMSCLDESPPRLGRSVDLFDRQAWRAVVGCHTDTDCCTQSIEGCTDNTYWQPEASFRLDESLLSNSTNTRSNNHADTTYHVHSRCSDLDSEVEPPVHQQSSTKGTMTKFFRGPTVPETSTYLNPSQYDGSCEDPHHHSMSCTQREGLYRYFIDSDSPVHRVGYSSHMESPSMSQYVWTTPMNRPAALACHPHYDGDHLKTDPGPRTKSLFQSATLSRCRPPRLSWADEQQYGTLPNSNKHKSHALAPYETSQHLDMLVDGHTNNLMNKIKKITPQTMQYRTPLKSVENSPLYSPQSAEQHTLKSRSRHMNKGSGDNYHPMQREILQSPKLTDTENSSLSSPVQLRPHRRKYKEAAGKKADRRSASITSPPPPTMFKTRLADYLR